MSFLQRLVILVTALTLLMACGAAEPTAPAATQPLQGATQDATTANNAVELSPTSAPTATEPPIPTEAPTATPIPTETPLPTEIPTEPGSSRSAPLPLGSELSFKDWAVTITTVLRGAEANQAIASANQFNAPAPEGWHYIIPTLSLTNISSDQEAKNVSFAINLRLTGDRNILYPRTSAVVPQQLEGELFPEGSTVGQVAFLVPVDEQNLIFFVDEQLSFDRDTRRFVAVDEGASISPDPALRDRTPTDLGSTRASPAAMGSTTSSPDWEITLLEVRHGDEAAQAISEANQFNSPAPEGEAYIMAYVRARYLGHRDADHAVEIRQSDFKVTGSANTIYPRPSVVPPTPNLEASLYPGGQVEGWVVVQANSDERNLTLIYEPMLDFGSENRRFLSLE